MRKDYLLKIIFLIITTLLISGGFFTDNALTEELPSTIKFGLLSPMTGPQAKWGEWASQGINLAVDEINARGGIHGKKIEVIVGDDRFQASQAALLLERMITQDKILAFYITTSFMSLAASPISEKYKVLELSNCYGPPLTQRGAKYYFRVCPNADVQNISVINYMVKERGAKEFANIRDSGEYGETNSKSYTAALASHGLAPLTVEVFKLGDKDFTGQLLRIKNTGAKFLILATTDVDSAAIIRQVKMMNLPLQGIGNASQGTGLMAKILGQHIEGLIFSGFDDYLTSKIPRIVEFREKFNKKYNQLPGSFICLDTYDTIQLLKTAIERAWPNITEQGLRDGMASISTKTPNQKGAYQGLLHKFDYDETGEGVKTSKVWQYNKNGEMVLLKE